jgi:predicted RNase H-like nuclease
VRIFGADLSPTGPDRGVLLGTLVALDPGGSLSDSHAIHGMQELAAEVGRAAGAEPFLLGVNIPVAVPAKQVRSRPLENILRRRIGFRLPQYGRAALQANPGMISGESLLAVLAGSGLPCLTYPERNQRSSGLAEIHPALVLKTLLWVESSLAGGTPAATREELFKAYTPPAYRIGGKRGKSSWQERAAAADLCLRAIGPLPGYDTAPAREALASASAEEEFERAVSLLDATLIAGTASRYLEAPEECAFIGERESGYVIVPADGFIRRLALKEPGPGRGRLFPQESLREQLESVARIRPLDLLAVGGRPQRLEAVFTETPLYEFDNLDEMLWWKHCRHLSGPVLPTEGLVDLVVQLGTDEPGAVKPLSLARSRHKTLSFRFETPEAWRARISTRDGKIYPFRVLRATYETLPGR